ncbi:hypothetical protein U9M48_021426, partial [Paspalum notatum var. saurae]
MSHTKRQLLQDAGDKQRSRRRRRRQKHLYLVLDDWDKGFRIHKMDTDSFFDCDDDDDQRLLEAPPVLRLESPVGHGAYTGDMSFSALGTKIFVFMNQRCGLVYDAETAVMAVGAHAPAHMVCGFGISVAVGDVLYVLTYRFFDENGQHWFQAICPTAQPTKGWSWETMPAPPSSFTTRQRVISYALHPDGSTIFMTTAYRDTPGAPLGTYSFNTKGSVWRWHGEWALPFLGRAYFDGELDAWVGLHRDGYISSCQVVSPGFHSNRRQSQSHYMYVDPSIYLDCQMTKEKLFLEDRTRYMGASLVYIGGRSKFCLVECVASEKRPAFGDHGGCVLHATIFGLKYNQRGELETTNQRSTRSFRCVPSGDNNPDDDQLLYATGPLWLEQQHTVGRAA